MTFLASTGRQRLPGGFPAFSPNVVAVGGTTLTINSTTYAWVSETGWSGSGGGQSVYESEPSYQLGVQTSGMRQIPDISFDADPASGVAVYDSYDYGSIPSLASGRRHQRLVALLGRSGGHRRPIARRGRLDADGWPDADACPLLYAMKAGRFPRHYQRQQRLSRPTPATTKSPASAVRWPTN